MADVTIIKVDETCGADEVYGPVLKCEACQFQFVLGSEGDLRIPNFCPNCGLRNDGPKNFPVRTRHDEGGV